MEKGMVTHSSILAWKIPWTEEPRGLQAHYKTSGHKELDTTERLTHTHTHTPRRVVTALIGRCGWGVEEKWGAQGRKREA